jgi:hypothetical protein
MKTDTPKTKKFPRPVKVLFWLGGALVVYTAVGFLVAPAVIKSQLLKRLPAMLGRPVAVASVKVNPYALSLTVRGLAVNEKNGAPFAGFDEFYARLKYASFFQRGWAVQEISLTHPFAGLVRGQDGKLNFDDIAATLNPPASTPATASKSALPLVVIDSLHIDQADVSVEDFVPPTPVKFKLIPIHLLLDHLSTDPKARNPCSFTARSDTGEKFEWYGIFSLQPLQVSGHFKITGLDLKKYSPYLAPFASAGVTDGKVDLDANYDASLGTNGPDLSLENGNVLVRSLSVKSSDPSETVLTLSFLSVKLVQASLGKKLLHLALVKTSDGSLLARQNQDGTINLLSLLKLPANSLVAPPAAGASQAPWTIMVDEIAVDRYNVALEDKKPPKPAKFNLTGISFDAKNFSTVSNAPLAVDVAMGLNEAGRFTARGAVRLQPPSADLVVDVTGMDLRPLQPYVEQQVKLAVGGGLFTVRGHASYNSEKGAPMAAFEGDFGLTNFTTTDLIQFKDFVTLQGLAVNGIQSTFQPNRLDVQEVKLSGLSTSIIMETNHQINLLAVLPAKPASSSNAPPPPAAGLDFPVTLASFVIDKASLHFSDQSIEPPCQFDVQEFGGSVKGLSSRQDARAAVDLRGKVDDVSTFSVTGAVNPLSKDLVADLAIDCKNVNLSPFTPYMEKYGGFPLQRGKLLVDLHHNIAHGKLTASNHIIIAGLSLGPKNQSTNATKLPVKLGIALLKDRNGNITLDVPFSGSLSNPDFRVMPIVMQVFGNILSKAATSPFTLLGALFGGGEEMSCVDFPPGLAGITPSEQAKLDKLAKALYERPGLQVEISAGSDPVSDTPILARLKLDDQIRSLQASELIAAGTPPETVQSMKVDPTNYTRLLKALYLKTIVANTNTASPAVMEPALPSTPSTASTTLAASKPREGAPTPRNVTILPTVEVSAQRRAAFIRPHLFVKGGEQMMRITSPGNANYALALPPAPKSSSKKPIVAKAAQNPKPEAAATTNTVAAAGPSAAPEPTQDQMEAGLLATIQISSDDLRALMQARARGVQAALVNSGKVEAGRLFILAPGPISPAAKGQSRANLALQ